jgi:hypothetical protein
MFLKSKENDMTKRYEMASSDLTSCIEKVRGAYYGEALQGVEVGALFIADDSGEKCLMHQGYPASALCRLVPGRDRAAGLPDAQIIVDRAVWQMLNAKEKAGLIDHELHHIEVVYDEDGNMRCDAQDRPQLRIRKHDRQFGWFDEVAQRHGEHSMEVRQAKQIIAEAGQLYFDFSFANAA